VQTHTLTTRAHTRAQREFKKHTEAPFDLEANISRAHTTHRGSLWKDLEANSSHSILIGGM